MSQVVMHTFQLFSVFPQAGDDMVQGPVGSCVPVHSQFHNAHTHILKKTYHRHLKI
jgi:hypothetical protein